VISLPPITRVLASSLLFGICPGDGPDEVYDRVEYTYNRQSERVTKKDQNETVHAYEYDALGRPTADKVTAVGSGVDDAVRRIATAYEVRGMVATITSYATATDSSSSSSSSSSSGASDGVNQVVFEYDDLGKLVKEYQEHDGVKDANTPYVGYEYDDTSSSGRYTNGLRPTALRYPNGRLVHYTYGDSGSTADALNRIDAICDDDSGSPGDVLAQYSYLGSGSIVQVHHPEPDLRYDLAHGVIDGRRGRSSSSRVAHSCESCFSSRFIRASVSASSAGVMRIAVPWEGIRLGALRYQAVSADERIHAWPW